MITRIGLNGVLLGTVEAQGCFDGSGVRRTSTADVDIHAVVGLPEATAVARSEAAGSTCTCPAALSPRERCDLTFVDCTGDSPRGIVIDRSVSGRPLPPRLAST